MEREQKLGYNVLCTIMYGAVKLCVCACIVWPGLKDVQGNLVG